jgi:hypothetical protein
MTKRIKKLDKTMKRVFRKFKTYKPLLDLETKECGENPFSTNNKKKKETYRRCENKFWNKRSHPAYLQVQKDSKIADKEKTKCVKKNCMSMRKISAIQEKDYNLMNETCGPSWPTKRNNKNYLADFKKNKTCRLNFKKTSHSNKLLNEYHKCIKTKCKKEQKLAWRYMINLGKEHEIMMDRSLKELKATTT